MTLKKPTRAFGALFGNSAKRKFDPEKRVSLTFPDSFLCIVFIGLHPALLVPIHCFHTSIGSLLFNFFFPYFFLMSVLEINFLWLNLKEKEESKLEQIKSTVSLPFHAFSGGDEKLLPEMEEYAKISEEENPSAPAADSTAVDIIVLDDESDMEDSKKVKSDNNQVKNNEAGEEEEPLSVSDLSFSFQKCFPSLDQAMSSKLVDKSRARDGPLVVTPFDYEAARKEMKFGKGGAAEVVEDVKRRERRKGVGKDEGGTTEHPQGRRRQAFPASGNRSATFR